MVTEQNNPLDDVSPYAATISAEVVRSAQEMVLDGRPATSATEEECGAVLGVIMSVCAMLESYLISSLPPDYAKNVRAALENMADRVQKQKNKLLEMGLTPTDASGRIPLIGGQKEATVDQPNSEGGSNA